MLDQIFALYIESLIYTAVGVGIIAGLWIGLRMIRRIMTIPVLSFATLGLLIVLKA